MPYKEKHSLFIDELFLISKKKIPMQEKIDMQKSDHLDEHLFEN